MMKQKELVVAINHLAIDITQQRSLWALLFFIPFISRLCSYYTCNTITEYESGKAIFLKKKQSLVLAH